MPFTAQSIEEKPYNMCLNCIHIGKKCDGPNFLAMSTDRWCEWCRLRKEYLGWTNAHIAELADISKISVDRVMSGNVKDLRISTMQAVTKVLVNGSWGQYPCAMTELSESEPVYVDNPEIVAKLNKSEAECERLRSVLDGMAAEHKAELATAHSQDETRIEYLKEKILFQESQMAAKDKQLEERYAYIMMSEKRKNRIIGILATALAISVLIIITALVIDRLNSDIGFFWVDRMSSLFEGNNFGNSSIGTVIKPL